MARIRTIKPEFWSDEKVGGLPLACRLLFIGLWNFADDYGVIASSPLFIKSRIFLYDRDISEENVQQWLCELEQRKMIVPCEHGGNHYYIIRNFSKHQVVNKKSQSRTIPRDILEQFLEASSTPTVALREASVPEQGTEKGTDNREEERKAGFREMLQPFTNQYSPVVLKKFTDYWTAPSQTPGKMRFEDFRGWDSEDRLEAWMKKERTAEKGISASEALGGYGGVSHG